MLLKRINTFVTYSKLSYNKFEKSIKASRGTISGALKHNRTIGSNVVENILLNYPELSAEWLLRGKGEMLNIPNSLSTQNEKSLTNGKVDGMINFYTRMEKGKLVEALESIAVQHNASLDGSADNPLEHFILRTLDKKYGSDLKNIKRQLEIFFRERLNQTRRSETDESQNEDKYIV